MTLVRKEDSMDPTDQTTHGSDSSNKDGNRSNKPSLPPSSPVTPSGGEQDLKPPEIVLRFVKTEKGNQLQMDDGNLPPFYVLNSLSFAHDLTLRQILQQDMVKIWLVINSLTEMMTFLVDQMQGRITTPEERKKFQEIEKMLSKVSSSTKMEEDSQIPIPFQNIEE